MYSSNIDHNKLKYHQHNENRELNLERVRGMWRKVKTTALHSTLPKEIKQQFPLRGQTKAGSSE